MDGQAERHRVALAGLVKFVDVVERPTDGEHLALEEGDAVDAFRGLDGRDALGIHAIDDAGDGVGDVNGLPVGGHIVEPASVRPHEFRGCHLVDDGVPDDARVVGHVQDALEDAHAFRAVQWRVGLGLLPPHRVGLAARSQDRDGGRPIVGPVRLRGGVHVRHEHGAAFRIDIRALGHLHLRDNGDLAGDPSFLSRAPGAHNQRTRDQRQTARATVMHGDLLRHCLVGWYQNDFQ